MSRYPTGKRKKIGAPKIVSKSKSDKDPSSYVLRMLLNASPYYVSGSVLAQKLKMSRVGVWSRIDKLRKAGLTIEASQNLGYRLAGEPNALNLPLLNAWMKDNKKICDIFTHDEVDSTNSEVERLLANGFKSPFAVLSNEQKKGRGRLGRIWHSPKGGNIYLSLGFRPNIQAIHLRNFTLWQGLNICRFLRLFMGTENIKVKWPNDIYYGGKKIAGMLTEASIDSESIKTLIFGIGLNVNTHTRQYPKSIAKNSISMQNIKGEQIRIHELAAKLIKVVLSGYKDCMSKNLEKELVSGWDEVDELSEKKIKVQCGKEIFSGKASGIDKDGNLLLKLRNGRFRKIHGGEIEIL
jgi:BirA family biotin operon repressor/biotin-[acetyl-CoA-carboxylase] ligase